MKKALHRTITFLAAIIGLTLPFANGAYGSTDRHELPSGVVAGTFVGDSSTPAIGLSLGFAMADFTGDTHPDVAIVELNGFHSASAEYVIEVRLTEGGGQLLRVRAPFGGLLVTAKDLTGDGNLDLVIREARSRAPVAIFLNDGSGHFSAAERGVFAKALPEAASGQEFTTHHYCFSATLVSPRASTIGFQRESARSSQKQNGSLFIANYDALSQPFLPFGLNRAPPTLL
jgi:hypothetical protein